MTLKRKIIISISVMLLIAALFLVISDLIRKKNAGKLIPCCEQISSMHDENTVPTVNAIELL